MFSTRGSTASTCEGRRAVRHTACATALMIASLWAPPASARLMAPRCPPVQRSQAYVAEGDGALDRGDYQEAINKYRAAYYGLPPSERVSYVGSLSVRNAMQAFGLLFESKQDPVVLRRQLGFLNEFLDQVAAQEGGVEKVGATVIETLEGVREQVEQKLASLTKDDAPQPEPPPPAKAEDAEDQPPPPVQPPAPDPARREPERAPNWLGIGLTAGGGVLTAVGAGVLVGWWTVRQQAANYVELTPEYGEGTDARADYLAQQQQDAQAFRIAGSVLVSVGAATLTGGVVYLLLRRQRARRSTETLTLRPHLGPRSAGVAVGRRF